MTIAVRAPSNKLYITRNCFALVEQQILVNSEGQSIAVASLPWSLLTLLVMNPGRIVPYSEIIRVVFGDVPHTVQSVATLMARLRKYFKDLGIDDESIHKAFTSFRGKGILFVPES